MHDLPAHPYTRRELLKLTGKAVLVGAFAPRLSFAAVESPLLSSGSIVGDPIAAKVGEKILQEGGNAIDAAIATAFAAGICTPRNCGVGGYGGHAVIALAGGKKVTSIDFNSTAPMAARPDMFPVDEKGAVKGSVNTFGWLAAGVPGTVAGLELALTRYGTRSLRETLAPAIDLCERTTRPTEGKSAVDTTPPAAKSLPPLPPERERNRALTGLLRQLANDNSTESFYRGEIAGKIADAFKRNGGLVTRDDLAAYRAREVAPLTLEWNGLTLHTAPLTATGALLLEAYSVLKALDWANLPAPQRLHAKLESLRIAWADRLHHFGDPEQVKVPMEKLLSAAYAGELAEKVSAALKAQKPVPLAVDPSHAGGTTNISAVDRHGNMIAITLTHGGSFGARVLVDELGMVLGHGMSRFDPRPGLANSPGPGKRPINNMCPTVVTRGGIPILAVGGAGGTRIPNSLYEVLLNYVGLGTSLDVAMKSPRLDTNGTLTLSLETRHSAEDEAFFRTIGYTTKRGPSANISAALFDPATKQTRGISNGTM